jgi:hypothetical protein
MIVPLALLVAIATVSTQVMAAAPSVRFSTPVNVSNTGERSRWPSVAFDNAGKAHITWLQQADVGETGRIMYTNNVGGAFLSPVQIDRGEGSVDHSTSIVVENNRVHVFASTADFRVSHILLTLNGAQPSVSSRTQLGDRKSTATAAAVDTTGRVHAAWISNEEGEYQVYHRIWANGDWQSGARRVKPEGRMQKYPNLAATSDGRIHLGFRSGNPGDSKSQGTFSYLEWNGSSWQDASDPPAGANNDTVALGSEGTNLYAIWENSDSHKLSYARRVNGSWSDSSDVPGQDTYNNQPTFFGSATTGRAYAVWSRGGASGDREEIVVGEVAPNGGWSDVVRLRTGEPEGARGASGGGNLGVVWHDKPSGDIWFASVANPGTPAPGGNNPPPPPPATPTKPAPTPTPTPKVTPTPKPSAPNAPATGTFGFGSNAYSDLWNRTDSLVKQNAVPYSWVWGPNPFTQGFGEYYVQSPGASRFVQYFDKSRMEINQPDAPRNQWYVSNGRLADELITGQMQVGDAQYEQRQPAGISVVGDPDNTFPYYRDFRAVYRRTRSAGQANEEIYRAPDGSVQTKPVPNANTDPSMAIVQRVNGLGVPKVFWDFMNRSGQVVEDGRTVTASPLFDWRYVIGEPLTEAYWTYVKVNGQYTGVLVQAFERRVLTFTPTNSGQFQVEMGNIGRHYFEWRYGVRPR